MTTRGVPAFVSFVPFVPFVFSGKESIATDPAHLFVRARGESSALVPLGREQLHAVDPELPVYDIEPFEERVRALLMTQRTGVALFTLFSILALTLATIGIYGVASCAAAARTREIGVRIALGATQRSVCRRTLRRLHCFSWCSWCALWSSCCQARLSFSDTRRMHL